MIKIPNFREFYQRPPILIGASDLETVNSIPAALEPGTSFTHWLIALIGDEHSGTEIKWKVAIYPSRENGEFDYLLPYFVSSIFESIHEAIDYSKQLAHKAKSDQLNTVQIVHN